MNKKIEQTRKWYVLYTMPNFEKKVEATLSLLNFEVFLPTVRSLKVWSDRKKWIVEPMFKGYLFIELDLERDYLKVLNLKGVCRFVGFEGKPAVVDPREIAWIKSIQALYGNGYNSDDFLIASGKAGDFIAGEEVQIKSGPLTGVEGKLIRFCGQNQVLVELKSVNHYFILKLKIGNLSKRNVARNYLN